MNKAQKTAQMLKQLTNASTYEELNGVAPLLPSDITKAIHGPQQYAFNGTVYFSVSATVPSLPPGVYKPGVQESGPCFEALNIVTDDLITLPDSQSDLIIAEIEKFWGLKEKFEHYGYLHKRGFLIHGPQGSGKSSTINIVAKKMIERGGVVFFSQNPFFIALGLTAFRIIEPDRPAVVVMEDIDAIADNSEEALLQLLDGGLTVDNVVFLATTNYPENLDLRLRDRPSRFDRVVEIANPNEASRKVYLRSRLDESQMSEDELDVWAKSTEGLSFGHLRELVVSVKVFELPFDETVKRLQNMHKTITSQDYERKRKGKNDGVGFVL